MCIEYLCVTVSTRVSCERLIYLICLCLCRSHDPTFVHFVLIFYEKEKKGLLPPFFNLFVFVSFQFDFDFQFTFDFAFEFAFEFDFEFDFEFNFEFDFEFNFEIDFQFRVRFLVRFWVRFWFWVLFRVRFLFECD